MRTIDESSAVVVALVGPPPSDLDARLARFAEEAGPRGEVVLMDASGCGVASRLAKVRVLVRSPGRLAPELWRDGLLATDTPLIALTTAQMIPTSGWLAALRGRMNQTGAAGVGGPITPGDKLTATDRAVALLRYANYFPSGAAEAPILLPSPPGKGVGGEGRGAAREVRTSQSRVRRSGHDPHPGLLPKGEEGRRATPSAIEPPGDNALYRRDALMTVEPSWLDGFWEVEVHAALRARGESLAMADRAILTFHGGVDLKGMTAQRYQHARRYAIGRSKGFLPTARWARLVAEPLVPPLLGLRAIRALRDRRLPLGPWIPALPAMAWLATAWAIGEGVGIFHDDHNKHSKFRPMREIA